MTEVSLQRAAFRGLTSLIATGLALISGPAMAQQSQSAVVADITQPQVIVKTADLRFGTILRGNTAGTVTINASTDNRTRTGGVTLVNNDGGAARFTVNGRPSLLTFISLGPAPVLTRQGGGGTMTSSALTLNGGSIRFLNLSGTMDLRVGGRLAVGANQPSGRYSGTFDITVTYF